MPWRSAATTYMQKTGTAGPLIVIDVVTSASRMSAKSTSMSAAESMATPQWPDLAEGARVVGVPAHQGRHVEGDGEPVAAGVEDRPVPLVGVLGAAEAGELPDRPRLAAIAGRVEAAGERVLARPADPLEARVRRLVGRAVDRLDRRSPESVVKSASRSRPAARRGVVALLPAFAACAGLVLGLLVHCCSGVLVGCDMSPA